MSTEDIQGFLAQIKTGKEDTIQLIYIIANQDAQELFLKHKSLSLLDRLYFFVASPRGFEPLLSRLKSGMAWTCIK
jgi:hypothetical protein